MYRIYELEIDEDGEGMSGLTYSSGNPLIYLTEEDAIEERNRHYADCYVGFEEGDMVSVTSYPPQFDAANDE